MNAEQTMKLPFKGYDSKARSDETGTENKEPSLTDQSMSQDADINIIALRFGLTGQIPQNVRPPMYGDFTGITDYHGALKAIEEARDSFMKMPAELRAKLDNDPQKFLDYVADPNNVNELRRLGLALPKPIEPPNGPEKKEEVKA